MQFELTSHHDSEADSSKQGTHTDATYRRSTVTGNINGRKSSLVPGKYSTESAKSLLQAQEDSRTQSTNPNASTDTQGLRGWIDRMISYLFIDKRDEFQFKDYRPKLFAKLRSIFGIQSDEYAAAFRKTSNEKFSEGKGCVYI
jgi:hypothetical protein